MGRCSVLTKLKFQSGWLKLKNFFKDFLSRHFLCNKNLTLYPSLPFHQSEPWWWHKRKSNIILSEWAGFISKDGLGLFWFNLFSHRPFLVTMCHRAESYLYIILSCFLISFAFLKIYQLHSCNLPRKKNKSN